MDIITDDEIGSAIVTPKGGRYEPGLDRRIRMAAAFPATGMRRRSSSQAPGTSRSSTTVLVC